MSNFRMGPYIEVPVGCRVFLWRMQAEITLTLSPFQKKHAKYCVKVVFANVWQLIDGNTARYLNRWISSNSETCYVHNHCWVPIFRKKSLFELKNVKKSSLWLYSYVLTILFFLLYYTHNKIAICLRTNHISFPATIIWFCSNNWTVSLYLLL